MFNENRLVARGAEKPNSGPTFQERKERAKENKEIGLINNLVKGTNDLARRHDRINNLISQLPQGTAQKVQAQYQRFSADFNKELGQVAIKGKGKMNFMALTTADVAGPNVELGSSLGSDSNDRPGVEAKDVDEDVIAYNMVQGYSPSEAVLQELVKPANRAEYSRVYGAYVPNRPATPRSGIGRLKTKMASMESKLTSFLEQASLDDVEGQLDEAYG